MYGVMLLPPQLSPDRLRALRFSRSALYGRLTLPWVITKPSRNRAHSVLALGRNDPEVMLGDVHMPIACSQSGSTCSITAPEVMGLRGSLLPYAFSV
jgi:hypothetical protein